ncbi:MAG TPA: DNA alkylation repair protein [Clostridia bacterium]|nr:DNA alkylation repair protein [Clostridia bacterium]
MDTIEAIKQELKEQVIPAKAEYFPKFFQAFPGGYGEGDQFLGVTVPSQRRVAKKYWPKISLKEVEKLLQEPIHEYRLTALFILVSKFEHLKNEAERKEIVDLYLNNLKFVNNWDLVDSSADKILGRYLFDYDKEKNILYDFAKSGDLWRQRVAIIATFYFIKQNHFEDTLAIAKILLHHKHDLIHKAVGWMLREIGKRDFTVEYNFLVEHYKDMPRTMLRYAIEKFENDLRKRFLQGLI